MKTTIEGWIHSIERGAVVGTDPFFGTPRVDLGAVRLRMSDPGGIHGGIDYELIVGCCNAIADEIAEKTHFDPTAPPEKRAARITIEDGEVTSVERLK